MKELEGLFLIQFVLVDVLIALMSDDPSHHLNGRDRSVMNQIEEEVV